MSVTTYTSTCNTCMRILHVDKYLYKMASICNCVCSSHIVLACALLQVSCSRSSHNCFHIQNVVYASSCIDEQGVFRAPTPEEAASGEGLIGRKVNIFWSGTGEFFVARVSFFFFHLFEQ
jgi:hypothetical protein